MPIIRNLTIRRGLRQNTEGVAAVEFALLAPVLILLFFGAVELSNLLIADSRLRQVTASISDLLTQRTDGIVNTAQLTESRIAAVEIMRPLPVATGGANRLAVMITNYRTTAPPTASSAVWWSRVLVGNSTTPIAGAGGGGLGLTNPPCNENTLPASLLPKTATSPVNDVLRVRATYEWRPTFATIFNINYRLTSTNYNMPRYSLRLDAGTDVAPRC